MGIACEQAPGWVLVRASRVRSRASGASRERSDDDEFHSLCLF